MVAWNRRALHRDHIIKFALALPILNVCVGMGCMWAADALHAPDWMTLSIFFGIGGAYFLSSIGVIVWAHRAAVRHGPRGFPIEPTNTRRPEASDS